MILSLRLRRCPCRVAVAVAALLAAGSLTSCGADSAKADVPVVDVQLGNYTILPADLTVPSGEVDLRVTNVDTMVHSFVVAGRGTRQLAPGETQVLSVDTQPGEYRMWCYIPGHAQLGQTGTLRSVGSVPTTTNWP